MVRNKEGQEKGNGFFPFPSPLSFFLQTLLSIFASLLLSFSQPHFFTFFLIIFSVFSSSTSPIYLHFTGEISCNFCVHLFIWQCFFDKKVIGFFIVCFFFLVVLGLFVIWDVLVYWVSYFVLIFYVFQLIKQKKDCIFESFSSRF